MKKASPIMHFDISQETDVQMLTRIGKKFALLFVVLLMSDTLFDWMLGFLDLLVEGLHIVIDAIEYSVELILQYFLHTDHQHSEMIIVNGSILIALYWVYRLYQVMPQWYVKLQEKWLSYWSNKLSYWHALSWIRKSKLISVYSLGITCLFFLVTV